MTPSSPSAKDMGPIERELRTLATDWVSQNGSHWYGRQAFDRTTDAARICLALAALSVGTTPLGEDAWSEAIEAASELGL